MEWGLQPYFLCSCGDLSDYIQLSLAAGGELAVVFLVFPEKMPPNNGWVRGVACLSAKPCH
jgi:hypothetical protein